MYVKDRSQCMKWTNLNQSTQFTKGVEVGHARSPAHSRDDSILIIYRYRSERGRLVLNTCIPVGLFTLESASQFSLVQFMYVNER